MEQGRVHRVVAADGAAIAGRAHGQGPPLILVHGGLGDGETSWRFLLPQLVDRFTCYAMSTRGRGLSTDHPDHTLDALVGDVICFAESIGEPVSAMGHSSSLVLAAAGRTDAIVSVALHEPAVPSLAGEDGQMQDALARATGAAREGRLADAVRIFFEDSALFNEDEVAKLIQHSTYERMAPNVPAWCSELSEYGGAVAPLVLQLVRVPTLLLQGSRTPTWFRDSRPPDTP
jgi:pimeloyl-ACP methyl ester carboxylesterase